MAAADLYETARAIVANHKGILAADESTGTIAKRFDAIGVVSTEETRRAYRNLLFTTPGMEEFIGGVILYDETIRQRSDDGTPFADLLVAKGVVPGIKVDTGAKPLALFPGETVTEGLDGLRERLAEYHELGARFAKWRAVIAIGDEIPTDACLGANAHALARYAALCQEAGLVPIVEPEVLMDGRHTIETCDDVTGRTLRALYAALYAFGVHLRGTLLKPNMVIAGQGLPRPAHGRSDRRGDGAQPAPSRARGRSWGGVPLRRPDGAAGNREPECDQPRRRAVAALVLLRASPPGFRARGVGRRSREGRGRAECVSASGANVLPRDRRPMEPGCRGGASCSCRRSDRVTRTALL